jgi:ubiquinone/menaquinone biosynthesis C-methylase UbiE
MESNRPHGPRRGVDNAGKGRRLEPRPSQLPHDKRDRKAQPRPKPTGPKTEWTGAAEWYDRLVGDTGSEYQREVVNPGVLRMLGARRGEKVIDVACGQGVLCRLLSEQGIEVTGVDAAEPLVQSARERGPATIRYDVADARDLSFLPGESFAGAACVLAIQNIHPIGPVFASVARVLRPWGRFVLVMMHPCFRGPKETAWGWDAEQGVQFRRVDRYLLPRKAPIYTHPGSAPDEYTWSFHKPIEQYARSLRGAGLLIDAIEEWPSHKSSEPGPRAPAENTARKEIPMFLALRAVKIIFPKEASTT